VIGDNHKGETLYRWETSSGFQWMIFGDKDTHPVYKGDVGMENQMELVFLLSL